MTYSISLWGSDRTLGNDDNLTGQDGIASIEEAQRILDDLGTRAHLAHQWQFGYVDGPQGVVSRTLNPQYVPSEVEPDHEFAMQQGMGHGIDAYNEANGEDVTERRPAPTPFP